MFLVIDSYQFHSFPGKHPVSALTELCNKKKWGSPEFIMVHESGPDHKKNFLFKVRNLSTSCIQFPTSGKYNFHDSKSASNLKNV
jgi:dsRNA-specific ribonuclease